MSIVLDIFVNNLLPVFLVVGIGALLGVTLNPDVKALSRVTFYAITPCLAFASLTQTRLTGAEVQQIALFAILAMLAVSAIAWAIAALLRWERRRQRTLVLSVLVINSGNLGISVVLLAFGQEAQARALVYFVTTATVGNTLGAVLAAGGCSWRRVLSNVVRIPLIYATAGALIVNACDRIQVPALAMQPINLLSRAAVPMMLLILGLQLARSVSGLCQHAGFIALATALRLAVAPLVAFGVARLTGVKGTTVQVCMLEASTPSGVTGTILSLEYDLEPEVVTGTVFFSTLCSALTLSLLISVIR